jgi:hypothetical protein
LEALVKKGSEKKVKMVDVKVTVQGNLNMKALYEACIKNGFDRIVDKYKDDVEGRDES